MVSVVGVARGVSTLPPQMSAVLFWLLFSRVARALFSNRLVVGEHAQLYFTRS
jgi:hypothetical protein